jgi:hypothetical protein
MGRTIRLYPAIFAKIMQTLAPDPELQVTCIIENCAIACIVVMVSAAPFLSESWGRVYQIVKSPAGQRDSICFGTSLVHVWLWTREKSSDDAALQKIEQLTSAQLKGFAELLYRVCATQ